MVHQVHAHRVVHSQLEGQLQLGPHSVRRAHQDGILKALQVQPEERAKASYTAQYIAVEGLLRQVFDPLLGQVAAADIHAGVGIGYGFGFVLGFRFVFGLQIVRHCGGFLRMD